MNTNKVKIAYQNSKMEDDSNQDERQFLGKREIQTLKMLATEVGYRPKPQGFLLDLGCGDRFLKQPSESENFVYQGLDYTDVNFEVGTLPIKNNSVDLIVSLAVIEHLWDPTCFISEVFRCLKPGGLVYLSTPNFKLDWKNFYNDPTHVRPYTPESLELLLKFSGFTTVNTFPGLRCKDISWYRGNNRFFKAYYFLPFRADTVWPVPGFLKGHAKSIFALAMKPTK